MMIIKRKKFSARVMCILLTLILSIGSATFAYADTTETLNNCGVSIDKPIYFDVPYCDEALSDFSGSDGDKTPSESDKPNTGDNSTIGDKLDDDNCFDGSEDKCNDEYFAYTCEFCEFGCELCIFNCECQYECECEKKQMFAPFGYTIIASGTMDDLTSATNRSERVEGTAAWRLEQRYAPEHPFLTHVRTLYIGEPGIVGTLNRPGEMFPNFSITTPWQWGGLSDFNDINTREITKIVFEGPVQAGESLYGLFNNMNWVESIENIHYLDTSATISMAHMFRNVGNTRASGAPGANIPISIRLQLDLSTFDTSNVTSMQQMFLMMPLDYLNLSGWNTSNVTNMYGMFQGVHYLENLDVSHFDTSNVTNMGRMFAAFSQNSLANPQVLGRNSFNYLDVSNFDTSKVTTMNDMFYGAANITHLDLSHFDLSSLDPTSSAVMHRMFQGMHSLVELDISTWDTSILHPAATGRMFINNLTWAGINGPTAAQNTPNIRILHLGPNFRFSSGAGNPSSSLPNVPGGTFLGMPLTPHEWMGDWQEIGTGTIERPNGLIRTSTQLMANNLPMEGTWVWRPRIYAINFEGNGTVEVPTVGTMTPGAPRHPNFNENYTLAPNVFARDGYTFVGWNTNSDGTGTSFSDGYTFAPWTQASDMTLFAQWTPVTSGGGDNGGNTGGGDNGGNNGGNTGGGSGGGETTAPSQIVPPVPTSPFVEEHIWYVRGFPEGDFRPGNSITRAEISMILFRLIDGYDKYQVLSSDFSDVVDGWYAQAVSYLASRNIVTGFPDGTFRPNAPITRAELTAVLSRFFELYDNDFNDFSDVEATHWAIAYIKNAANRGWVLGFEDDTFRPDNATTRAEAVTMLNRVLGRIPNPETIRHNLYPKLNSYFNKQRLFTDMTAAHWAYYQIMEAAIEHDFVIDEKGNEIWTSIYIPWL